MSNLTVKVIDVEQKYFTQYFVSSIPAWLRLVYRLNPSVSYLKYEKR